MADSGDQEPEAARLARSAMVEYRAATAAQAPEIALRWLDRAHRLVPRDPNIMLALAGANLSVEPARAASLFATVTEDHDIREAWLGLAAARLKLGAVDQAMACVARALSRHVPRNDTRAVANQVMRLSQADGWCGVSFDGELTIRTNGRSQPVVALDGDLLDGTALPARWTRATRLMVMVEGRHLLGSPIEVHAIRRTEGIVEADGGGLKGWAWHPADPGRRVALTVSDTNRTPPLRFLAEDNGITIPDLGPLAHPFGFTIAAEALAPFADQVHVRGPDGRALYGSPVSPLLEQRAAIATARQIAELYPASGVRPQATAIAVAAPMPADLPLPSAPVGATGRPARGIAIVIPVHGQRDLTLACLDSVFATVGAAVRVIVVDDASPDPGLRATLSEMKRRRKIVLVRNPTNQGFAASVNAGLRVTQGRDVVLLNSDTLVPPGWLERLRDAAYGAADIGTVTPLSNDASILSYPDPTVRNPAPDRAAMARLDTIARAVGGTDTVDIPVGVGFCLYIRRTCLDAVGMLRADIFAQGYGEENDFCLRARRLGWRHVALPSLFVAHIGGQSFSRTGTHLRARNADLLERLHPGYNAIVQDFTRADRLAPFRRKMDLRRWRDRRPRHRESAILITHDASGGVEQRIRRSAADHVAAGRNAVVLRPVTLNDGTIAVEVGDGTRGRYPNLRYAMPSELPALLRMLRAQRPRMTEVHHFLDHHPSLHDLPAQLGVSYDVHIHDYAWMCPRILLVDGHNRYCGEPAVTACEACVADHGRFIPDTISVTDLRARSAAMLAGARQVIAPSEDAARRIARHFPGIAPVVVPHEDDSAIPIRLPPPRRDKPRRRVCVLGAIGVHKGYEVLLACARDAARRDLNLEFIIVGTTIDDARLLETGRVFVTGSYEAPQAVELVLRQDADLAFLPSIAPETWCMALTELWRAGLRVAAFDIGAPAERIRRTGRGFLLPPHLPPGAINNALVNAMASSDHPGVPARKRNAVSADLSHIVAKGP